MPTKEPTLFDRAKMVLRSIAFNRGVEQLQKSGDTFWEGPPMWQIQTDHEYVRFFAHDTALVWAIKQGLPVESIAPIKAHYTKPRVLQWYAKQKTLGMNVGNDAQVICSAHADSVDDMIAWFNGIERFDSLAALSLLKLGFSANRPDVTDVIAKWVKGDPSFWFNGNKMSGDSSDPFARRSDNPSQMCLFARCLSSVHLLEWLFEHQLHLKHMLFEPKVWAELQKGLAQAHADVRAQWPRIANHIFHVDVSPVDYDECQRSALCAMQLYTSFSHDPAAQCYLLYTSLRNAHGFTDMPNPCKNSNVETFHNKVLALQNHENASLLPTTPTVDKLMLAVYLDQEPKVFYQHAQMVFANAFRPDSVIPEMIISPSVFS